MRPFDWSLRCTESMVGQPRCTALFGIEHAIRVEHDATATQAPGDLECIELPELRPGRHDGERVRTLASLVLRGCAFRSRMVGCGGRHEGIEHLDRERREVLDELE